MHCNRFNKLKIKQKLDFDAFSFSVAIVHVARFVLQTAVQFDGVADSELEIKLIQN